MTGAMLRPWRLDDLPELERWLQPDQEWQQWDAPYIPKLDADQVGELVQRMREQLENPDRADPNGWALADAEGVMIGRITWYWEHRDDRWARGGITVFDPAVRGHGIGTAALVLWAERIFTETHAHRLDMVSWSGNTAMCRSAERAGFVKEAALREARRVRGERYDSVVYGMLRGEWEAIDR